MTALVLTNARLVGGALEPCNLVIDAGVVSLVNVQPAAAAGQDTLDLEGRFVMRGLWDHHVHVEQWAMARRRLDLSACQSAAECCDVVRRRLADARPPAGQPMVAQGHRDALWPDAPNLRALDRADDRCPVVLVAHDLHTGWLNTAAFRHFGLPTHPSGLVREGALHALLPRLGQVADDVLDGWVAEACVAAASRGVTGVVDLEMADNLENWGRRAAGGPVAVRVHAGVYPDSLWRVLERGLRTGDPVPGASAGVTVGPLKLFVDGSLNARTAYCHQPYPHPAGNDTHGLALVTPEELTTSLRDAQRHGLKCAVHAIGDRAATVALDAFEMSGAGGTVEHAQLLTAEDLPRFAALGVAASVQPGHLLGDRDVADFYWKGRTHRAFPYASLLEHGAEVRFGSDAPVSPLDPWHTIAAAVARTTEDRPPWHPEQRVSVSAALAASTRGRYTPRDGDPADLTVLDRDPLTATTSELASMPVHATMLAGRWTWQSDQMGQERGSRSKSVR